MTALIFLGYALTIIGSLWLLWVAFGEGLLWGLACLLIPFVSLVFAVTHWDRAKAPFLWQVGGFLILFGVASTGHPVPGF